MSAKPEYSAWLWTYHGPMSMFDGIREECENHIKGVYERFEKYLAEEQEKFRGKPHHPDCIPQRPNMELHRYIDPEELRWRYR
jgi:hypothetical protein